MSKAISPRPSTTTASNTPSTASATHATCPSSRRATPDGEWAAGQRAHRRPRRRVAQLWKAQVGRVPVYLLDTNCPENAPSDRDITHRLYGGDESTRIRQEMILGIGGIRALRALGHPAGRVASERGPRGLPDPRAAARAPGLRAAVRRRAGSRGGRAACSRRTRRSPPATMRSATTSSSRTSAISSASSDPGGALPRARRAPRRRPACST